MTHLAKTLAATLVASALALAALASPAHANPVTISLSGSYGYWGGNAGDNVCGKDWFSSYVQVVSPYISRTPAYPSHTQTIRLTSRVDQWNGAGWSVFRTQTPQTRTLAPGEDWALFSSVGFVTVTPGRYYRVVQFYEWFVGSVRVGTVTNLFDESEYSTWGPATVARTGAQASYCFIP
jgi:hypothetical protein